MNYKINLWWVSDLAKKIRPVLFGIVIVTLLVSGCLPASSGAVPAADDGQVAFAAQAETPAAANAVPAPTITPERPRYAPGELVDYIAQAGDTLPALAVHFNTTVEEIRTANPFIPQVVTTMPPGMPMKIPIYYAPFWGPAYQIIPDSLFVYGPAQVMFDVQAYVDSQPGWLARYNEFAMGDDRSGAEVVALAALNYSISPRLLLAMLEYQAGALSQPSPPGGSSSYVLGKTEPRYRGLYLQLAWAANKLNNNYYGWRSGKLVTFDHLDGRQERPDPWQNAATVSLQVYYASLLVGEPYITAVTDQGLSRTYQQLFGDPWANVQPHLEGSLEQPPLTLPFERGKAWAFTGGPHTSWGEGEPLAALDFAPGLKEGGCTPTDEWVTAVAPGVVVRSELGTVVLDLDKDGSEHTGWVIFYFHIGTEGRAVQGAELQTGDPIGHPSCEGGRSTGTHVHLARLYNGEWVPAGGILAFNLDGWVARYGARPYLGTLERSSRSVVACDCADQYSKIIAEK